MSYQSIVKHHCIHALAVIKDFQLVLQQNHMSKIVMPLMHVLFVINRSKTNHIVSDIYRQPTALLIQMYCLRWSRNVNSKQMLN